MSEQATISSDSPEPTWQPPIIEKTPPRPAPTEEYSWSTYNSGAKVIYIRNHEQANIALAALTPENGPLGFDLEWRPTFVKGQPENPAALVQLANENTIMLIQITAMREFPSKLVEVLANPEIVKAGVGIQSDASKLFNDYRVQMRNCVDLTLLAKTVDNARWAGKYSAPLGLARLIESYEYKLLPKGNITRSNWEAYLTTKQQECQSYFILGRVALVRGLPSDAFNDAHAGYILYRRLEAMVPLMETTPQPSWYTFNILSGSLCTDSGLPWHAENPNYDPGPMPPPRELTEAQREKIEQRKVQQVARKAKKLLDSASTSFPEAVSSPVASGSFLPGSSAIGRTIASSMAPSAMRHTPTPTQVNATYSSSFSNHRGRPYPHQRGRPRYHEYQQSRPNNTSLTNSNESSHQPHGPGWSRGPSNSAPHRSFHPSATYRGSGKRRTDNEVPKSSTSPNPQHRNTHQSYRPRNRGGSSTPSSLAKEPSSSKVASTSAGPPPANSDGS
ncbi:ribonuclease H-like domain-containing protein [Crepidotus variabilis]|uniref:3'-5' exonuclease n=1 Tax=Crepidotus variabilis TaxID=179855 RepID=A0A9P6EUI1_9AGAR|nr:ribonuclease H-like domain-containing protein [Crepidotus variabilis]